MKKSLKIDKKKKSQIFHNSKFDLSLSKDNPRNPSDLESNIWSKKNQSLLHRTIRMKEKKER